MNITNQYSTFAAKRNGGTITVPFFFISIAVEILKQIEEGWLREILSEYSDLFLVDVEIRPTNNIKVFIDGDTGFSIDACTRINRKLYKAIEEAAVYPEGNFSLEVSSPGITEPLKLYRQYNKNIGREVEVIFKDDSIKVGILTAVAESDIVLEYMEGKGKKTVVQTLVIPFDNIKTTTVQIKF